MKTKLVLLTLLVALAPAAALADTTPGQPAAVKTPGVRARAALYSFAGTLLSAPAGGSLSLEVRGGNPAALRTMTGQPVDQTFSYDSSTEFLLWQNGVPTVVSDGHLQQGDWVRVNIRAPRGADLSQIEQKAPAIVSDHVTEPTRSGQLLFTFRGRLTAVGSGSVSVDVKTGNRRALRLLIGQPSGQSFSFGSDTIVLLWRGKVPTVIAPGDLTVGDTVVVRVRAARGSSLSQVESTPAKHIGEHEPASHA